MRSVQILGNLQLTEQFSEVRKYSKVAAVLFICLTSIVVLNFENSKSSTFQHSSDATTTPLDKFSLNITTSLILGDLKNTSKPVKHKHDIYEELFASGFDKNSCISRYQRASFRKNQPYKPSTYLTSELRAYQELHSRCGPHTLSYQQFISTTLSSTSSSNFNNDSVPCKYLVWTPANGLGNRILSITSAFLYALLESRVLLVEFEAEMLDLFCEPFPNSTWVLPNDFPYKNQWAKLTSFKTLLNSGDTRLTHPVILLNLLHGDGDSNVRHFHCNSSQSVLDSIPVVILQSDRYFVPSLFFIPTFTSKLNRMFSEKGAIFHLLGHYLFNPSNEAWGLITRFYEAYLSKADMKIGLQIRIFQTPPKKVLLDQIVPKILDCTLNKHILPSFASDKIPTKNSTSNSISILVSSLYLQISEQLRNMYWTKPTSTGDVVGVYQPSHEEYQKFGDNVHNMKAWAEMYLLSLCDVLVTSGQSTFGYVAHGLAGLDPWVLRKFDGVNAGYPSCKRGISSDPCFHFAPKNHCDGNKLGNITNVDYHLRECEDLQWPWWGIKLVN